MGLTILQMLMAAATLLLPTFTMAQGDDVIIKVKAEQAEYFFYIGFSTSVFAEFHSCMGNGYNKCTVRYGAEGCPDKPRCLAQSITTSDSKINRNNQFYTCTNKYSEYFMECERQAKLQPTEAGSYTYRRPSSFPSVCVGFVWKFNEENITFDFSQSYIESCGADCTCPDNATTVTSQPATMPSSTSRTATSAPSSPSSSGGDVPIGVIVGVVVGVIVVAVVIIIVLVWRRRRAGAKSSGNASHNQTSAASTDGAKVKERRNDLHSYYNAEFSNSSGELQTANKDANKTNGYHNTLHQPSIIQNGVSPVKNPPKPQFTIKDNDSDFGYSTAQVIVPEDNNTKGKKSHDNYDYVSVEDDAKVTELKPETTKGKTPVVKPPKVKDDYAVVDQTRKTDLDQDFDYDCSRASDGYSTAGNINRPNLINDDPNATNVYSKLHEEARDIKNPYNVLPEQQGASDTNSALPDTADNAHDTKAAKPSKSLPYGKEDYAVVVKTKSTNKPTQASFQLRNDEN